jgi:hypothetical protein
VGGKEDKLKTLEVGRPFGTRVNAGDFEINRRLHLGLQLCGGGRHDASNIIGMLNLNVNGMLGRWSDMQETMAKDIIKIGKEVLDENLNIECELSPPRDGRRALHVASDSRWDKRGSGHCYDSLSGHSLTMGLRAQLPIEIEPMSSVCIKCTKGIQHEVDVCSKNYEGSAKGMEAVGAARTVKRLFSNEDVNCFVAKCSSQMTILPSEKY